jgi:hypothetical protein
MLHVIWGNESSAVLGLVMAIRGPPVKSVNDQAPGRLCMTADFGCFLLKTLGRFDPMASARRRRL